MSDLQGLRIHITGVVQGVGFRPFVYGLAARLSLAGWVRNTSAGVDIEVDGMPQDLQRFLNALKTETPPLARIDEMQVEERPANGFFGFEIVHSQAIQDAFQPISPDVSICPDCLRELFTPGDRRYRYPFINCTNCGPRFTIIQDIPYDRPKTTMAGFALCPDCAAEYANPLDRRFHAQPVACPECGPQVWLEWGDAASEWPRRDDAIRTAQRLLKEGKILAVKGLGGFHLACDATNAAAVQALRERKLRVDKPFAVMATDLETVKANCQVSPAEQDLLTSRERPIVVLERKPESSVAEQVTPRQSTLGVMLPYTPLHYLLLTPPEGESADSIASLLVMTSGNLSEEPIAVDNEDARQRLSALADGFLMHDRPIFIRCDDAVMRVQAQGAARGSQAEQLIPLRRSRGYAPFPVRLPFAAPPLLAAGAELKNTFCITHERYAFLSHHIGDLENYETLRSFEEGVDHFERMFRVHPQVLAYDLHPNYLATRYVLERSERDSIPAIGVQHHHAHVAACMAEHGLSAEARVIGVSLDGTGYGEDGAIWGGEFLVADYRSYLRPARLAYFALPGGDKAVREPWRAALALLQYCGIPWSEKIPSVHYALSNHSIGERGLQALAQQIRSGINAPQTSSMGRLFDVAAALAGVRQTVNYEAQAAIELEALADPNETGAYRFELPEALSRENMRTLNGLRKWTPGDDSQAGWIQPAPLIEALVEDVRRGVPLPVLSARFHNGVAQMIVLVCQRLGEQFGTREVALSGGVWQNLTLLRKVIAGLEEQKFIIYTHHLVPSNDGGLALGQAAVAARALTA